ncbi:MAG: hypothetical protein ACFFCV_09995 [Promethearchaeota archaeon]
MSKIKKKRFVDQKAISDLNIRFAKIFQFSGWFFLLLILGFMAGWILLDTILDIVSLELTAMTFSFIIFTGTNSAISFALATKIKNSGDKKRQYFLDWLLGEFIFCMLAVFAVAAYQW